MKNAEEDHVRAVVQSTGVYGATYKSTNSKWVLTNENIAKYSLSEVLNGLVGKTVFGTGFPLLSRKYPSSRVLEDYVIIFDLS